jgi:hypothetical protein
MLQTRPQPLLSQQLCWLWGCHRAVQAVAWLLLSFSFLQLQLMLA